MHDIGAESGQSHYQHRKFIYYFFLNTGKSFKIESGTEGKHGI